MSVTGELIGKKATVKVPSHLKARKIQLTIMAFWPENKVEEKMADGTIRYSPLLGIRIAAHDQLGAVRYYWLDELLIDTDNYTAP